MNELKLSCRHPWLRRKMFLRRRGLLLELSVLDALYFAVFFSLLLFTLPVLLFFFFFGDFAFALFLDFVGMTEGATEGDGVMLGPLLGMKLGSLLGMLLGFLLGDSEGRESLGCQSGNMMVFCLGLMIWMGRSLEKQSHS